MAEDDDKPTGSPPVESPPERPIEVYSPIPVDFPVDDRVTGTKVEVPIPKIDL